MSETNAKKRKRNTEKLKGENTMGVARRSIWYWLRLMLLITLVVAACYYALVEMMNISNVYIIVHEGLEKRADCILGNIPSSDLSEHFYKDWLLTDAALDSGKYDAFRVDSYDYRFSIEKISVYPWSDKASMRVVEQVVNIQASPYNDNNKDPVPEWDDSRMEVKLEKIDGRWYITELEIIDSDPETDPGATPDYSQLETDIPHY